VGLSSEYKGQVNKGKIVHGGRRLMATKKKAKKKKKH
jgi:hypothetical protein